MSLSVENLGHRYGHGEWLFRHLTRTFPAGKLTALVGPSGSGKSTLLRILTGALTPAEGSYTASGDHILVRQHPAGFQERTVLDHLSLPLLARGQTRAAAEIPARRVAELFGIAARLEHPYRHLSGGEAQRLGLGMALLVGARIILVDEPTAALDSRNADDVIEVLGQLASDGATVGVATHAPRVVRACDEVLELGEAPR